ncbi:MAG: terminase family protein [Thermodesulfobacteriota bacterium]
MERPEDHIAELADCVRDPWRFMRHVKTEDQKDLANPVKPLPGWAFVKEMVEQLHANRLTIWLKSRQMMATWVAVAYAVWEAWAHTNRLIGLVSKREKDAWHLKDRARFIWANLPEWMQPELGADSAGELEFKNMQSKILCLPAGPDIGRTYTFSRIILDEAAWQPYGEEIFKSLKPTIEGGGALNIISTPRGRGNMFARIWSGRGRNGFESLKVHYSQHPQRDKAWVKEAKQAYPQSAWDQEYECSFEAMEDAVFKEAVIQSCIKEVQLETSGQPGHRYVTGWDLARKKDYTVGVTLDVTESPVKLVAFERFRNKPWPLVAEIIEAQTKTFPGKVIIDSTGLGDPVLQFLNVPVEGFIFTARSKLNLIQSLVLNMERGEIQSPNIPQLVEELRDYRWLDKGLVTDCVMALALAASGVSSPPAFDIGIEQESLYERKSERRLWAFARV